MNAASVAKDIVLVMMEMAEMVVHDHDVHGCGSWMSW